MKTLRELVRPCIATCWLALTLGLSGCGGGSASDAEVPVVVPPVTVTAPAISAHPAAATVVDGQAASFTVSATGTAPLSYQWQRDGANINGATAASFALATASTADAGARFQVVVSNSAGSVTSASVALTVNAAVVAPTISTQPVSTTVVAGSPASFQILANGSAPLAYQWQRNGVDISGATSASYALAAPTAVDSGASYRVVVSNAAGSQASAAAMLTIGESVAAPTITVQPQSVNTLDGAPALLSVDAAGTGPFSYQWRKNGSNLAGATASIYVTPALLASDSGAVYSVVVSNGGGTVTSGNATVTVNLLPLEFFVAPQPTTVAAGTSAAFFVLAPGSQPITYQWRRNGVAIAGATAPSHFTPATNISDDGALYSVVVTNPVNSLTSADVRLTVTGAAVAPAIATAPASVTVSEGQAATFSATATGSAPLAYQWLRNGATVAGATASSYTTAATVASDTAARYTVRVSNAAGNVTSAEAVLTVQAATGGLVGRTWAAGQQLEGSDNEVLNHVSVIDDNGRVTTMSMQWNGTRWQLFAVRGVPGAAGTAPVWTTPVPLDTLAGQAVFADSRYNYRFDLAGSPNGNAVAIWGYTAPCTANTYRTRAGDCQYVYTARYLASTGSWEAPVNAGGFPGDPKNLQINNRGDVAFAATGGVPTTSYPYFTSQSAVAWRAVTSAGFTTQLLQGPISTYALEMDNSGNLLVGAALTQNATTDAAAYRGNLTAGMGAATVLDTRGSAVSAVRTFVGSNGQQLVLWSQNNGTRTSLYAATSANDVDALAIRDLGITNWDYLHTLDNGQLLLVDYGSLRRYRWTAGTWSAAETIVNWTSGLNGSVRCNVARNGDGICVESTGLYYTYDSARNVLVQRRTTTSPGAGYVLGVSNSLGFATPILSTSGVAFVSSRNQRDVLPTPAAPAGDGRNVVNLWGFYLK